MTDTNTMEPTDEELEYLADSLDLYEDYAPGRASVEHLDPVKFARAVLAKWGAPAPASQHVVDGESPVQHTQDGSGPVREPLSSERVKEVLSDAGYDDSDTPDSERAAFINGLRNGELEHGITAAQNGGA